MPIRIQYPKLFEPVSTASERTTPDKWWMLTSQPTYRPFVAALVTCLFFVPPPIVRAESWERRQSEPVRAIEDRHSHPSVFYGVKDFVPPIDWFVVRDNPLRLKPITHSHPSVFLNPKDFPPSMDWFVVRDNPLRIERRDLISPAVALNPKDFPPSMSWFSLPENPVRGKWLYWASKDCYVQIVSAGGSVTLDKWFSECLLNNPVLYVRKDYAYLYYQRNVLIFPLEVGTKVVHIDNVREVLTRTLPPDVLRQGLNPDTIHIDFQPNTNWMSPGTDPTIK